MVIFGEGKQTRDFVYVDDVIDALVAAATARRVEGEVINVGSGQEVSLHDLAVMIGKAAGQPEILHSNAQTGGVARLCADIGKARRLLNYTPKVSLEAGLRLTLERDPRSELWRPAKRP
jgi:UDP-glucose 4-epimerase